MAEVSLRDLRNHGGDVLNRVAAGEHVTITAELPDEPLISAVTLAELSVGPLATNDLRERGVRQARLQQAEAMFEPIPFDAAAAIAHGLPLHTVNPGDFAGIDTLAVVAVRHPST